MVQDPMQKTGRTATAQVLDRITNLLEMDQDHIWTVIRLATAPALVQIQTENPEPILTTVKSAKTAVINMDPIPILVKIPIMVAIILDNVLNRPAAVQTQMQGQQIMDQNQLRTLVANQMERVATSHNPIT